MLKLYQDAGYKYINSFYLSPSPSSPVQSTISPIGNLGLLRLTSLLLLLCSIYKTISTPSFCLLDSSVGSPIGWWDRNMNLWSFHVFSKSKWQWFIQHYFCHIELEKSGQFKPFEGPLSSKLPLIHMLTNLTRILSWFD